MPHPVFEIEPKIRDYVAKEIRLRDLQEWFARAKGPLLEFSGDLAAAKLAGLLQLALIEVKDGVLSERQLRAILRDELSATQFVVEGNPELTMSGSVTSTHVSEADAGQSSSVLHRILIDTPA